MKRRPIDFPEFQVQPYSLLAKQWLVLTCGDLKTGRYNSMTVGWGSFGVMWNKPFVQVVVRPGRYTFEFMNRYNTFTLCALGKKYRDALQILGTRSGRDGNKIAETGLTPVPSTKVAAPGFAEAQLIIELRKMYWDDFKPENFLDPAIEGNYPQKDYHRMFFGEILAIFGTGEYCII
ncbi:MAG TPA: flavin reductase [Deltaproteobacteria bacterium]|jgi:flavin reductase (DIM6/NTAB) family NADH-FMN oxidoreductase RutF|nr:flavin reductase [Deltaproteobacteria bacterium]HOI08473.1 flavin reductase [Deltaproteobacteria bacterium]